MDPTQINYLAVGTSQSRLRRGRYRSSSGAAQTEPHAPFAPSLVAAVNFERGATEGLSVARIASSSFRGGDGRVLC